MEKQKRVEFIESYIKIGNCDYQWNDNHGELIRCKDCKHWNQRIRCRKHKDWYCADGVRKDSE